jgi:hypothetical protein
MANLFSLLAVAQAMLEQRHRLIIELRMDDYA